MGLIACFSFSCNHSVRYKNSFRQGLMKGMGLGALCFLADFVHVLIIQTYYWYILSKSICPSQPMVYIAYVAPAECDTSCFIN